jgi:hypothetical protein
LAYWPDLCSAATSRFQWLGANGASRETFKGQALWEGPAHVFDLDGHSGASRAYAWSSAIDGHDKRRVYAVLGIGAIKTPLEAVRAAIVAENRVVR